VTGGGTASDLARTWIAGAGVSVVSEGAADAALELGDEVGLRAALEGVGAAGSTLLGLLPDGEAPGFELPVSAFAAVAGDPLVVVVGAGGLGCPAAIGLGVAGVRRIRLIDDDVVDISNLPRQVLHERSDLGRPKVESAAASLRERFPALEVEPVRTRLESGNADALLGDADLVLEGSDNFPTKFRVNAAAAKLGIPAVIGGVLRLEGQALAVDSTTGAPCYRCLFPESPAPGAVPTCSSAGILGPVAGVIGLWQVALGLELLVARGGTGPTPAGRFWTFAARTGQWMSFGVKRNPECVACGEEPDDPALRGAAEGDGPMCAG
jgi:molybdopterin/thiamine biosynthesis adenylyltransferase